MLKKVGKKVRKKVYLLGLIIILLIIVGSAYFLFIEKKLASEELTDKQVKAELDRIAELNSNLDYENIDLSEPWILFGTYKGRELVEGFSCSDVCPEYGSYKLIYGDVSSEEECERISGKTLYDYAWGRQFNGCEPVV